MCVSPPTPRRARSRVELVPEPVQGDRVVDNQGARIFPDEVAAELLGDASVDATVDDEGIIQFGFTEKQ